MGGFLPIYNELVTMVQRFEDIQLEATNRLQRLGRLTAQYPPGKVIDVLNKIHNLITGVLGFGKPLFEHLAKEGDAYEGEKAEFFLSTLLLQFQTVVGMEVRAATMLRTFIAHNNEDEVYASEVETIFRNLALQRSKYDPVLSFEWYLRLRVLGSEMLMSTVRWPNRFMYLVDTYQYVRGLDGHPGD